MTPFRRFLSMGMALLIVPVLFCGCGPSVDQHPAFTKLKKQVQDLEGGKASMSSAIDDLSLEVKTARGDIDSLEAALQTSGAPKIEELEKKIAEMAQRIQALEAKVASAATTTRPSASEPSAPASRPVARSTGDPAPRAKPLVRTPAAKGFYYSVKPGEDLEAVAKANNISVESLAQANHLPPGAKIYPGQSIFIPR